MQHTQNVRFIYHSSSMKLVLKPMLLSFYEGILEQREKKAFEEEGKKKIKYRHNVNIFLRVFHLY